MLTDSNILAMESDGDSAEVVIGNFAKVRASDDGVRSYASLLVSDHGNGLREVQALVKKLNIVPITPPSDTATSETVHTLQHLGTLKGHDFDTAFVAHEIIDHQSDIADAHKASAAATDKRVKALVDKSVPELQGHLDRAQRLLRRLSPPPDSAQ